MNVIITGGTGLLGNALAKDLIQDGHQVIALTRNPEQVKGAPAGIQLVKWDGRTSQGWGNLVSMAQVPSSTLRVKTCRLDDGLPAANNASWKAGRILVKQSPRRSRLPKTSLKWSFKAPPWATKGEKIFSLIKYQIEEDDNN